MQNEGKISPRDIRKFKKATAGALLNVRTIHTEQMSPGRRRPARTSTVARANAFVWPRALPAPGFAVTVAAGFLIVETVLVVLLKQVEPEDPVGIVYAVLMGVALVGNFVAGVAAAASVSADRRREAELSSALAHLVLRAGDLRSAADEVGRHLAAALNLRFVSVELADAAGDHRRGAIPLRDGDVMLGVLEVPDDLPRAMRQRLLRVVPTLEALLATARDRENVNDKLIESRRRLEQFFELTSDLMVISDEGKLLQVNPAFEQILGYTVDELAPAPFELVPPEEMDRLREPMKELTDGRGTIRFENRTTTCDGSSRWIEWSVAPHQGLFYAVGRDVTRQREEQEQLRETRTMLEASRDTLRELAEHQAGLRRVATLVARGANPVEVFDAVYYEMARCMHVTDARLSRYDDDKTATILTARHEPGMQNLSGGTRLTLADDELLSKVLSTGQPAPPRIRHPYRIRCSGHRRRPGMGGAFGRLRGAGSAVIRCRGAHRRLRRSGGYRDRQHRGARTTGCQPGAPACQPRAPASARPASDGVAPGGRTGRPRVGSGRCVQCGGRGNGQRSGRLQRDGGPLRRR